MKNRASRCSLINHSLGPRPSRPLFSMPRQSTLPAPFKPQHTPRMLAQVTRQVESLMASQAKDRLPRTQGYITHSASLVVSSQRFPDQVVTAYESCTSPLVLKGVIEPFMCLYVTIDRTIYLWSLEQGLQLPIRPPRAYGLEHPILSLGYGHAPGLVQSNDLLLTVCDPFDVRLFNCYRMAGEIYLQDLHIRVSAERQVFTAVLFAQGRLLLGCSEGTVREIRLYQRNLARLRFTSCYAQLSAKSQSLLTRLLDTDIKGAASLLNRTLRAGDKSVTRLESHSQSSSVLGLLEYRLQGLNPFTLLLGTHNPQTQKQIVVYSTGHDSLTFMGSISNQSIAKCMRAQAIYSLSEQATRISSFQLVSGRGLSVCVITLLFYRLLVEIELEQGMVKRPLIIHIREIKEPFQIARLRGSAPGSRLSLDYSLTSQVQRTQRCCDDLYVQVHNMQAQTCTLMRLCPQERTMQVEWLEEYDPNCQLQIYPLAGIEQDFKDIGGGFRARQVHVGCPLLVGFTENGYWVRARLRQQDQLCNLMLKSLLIFDKKYIEKEIADIKDFVTDKGEVQTCALLLSIYCNQHTIYWVESQHVPPHDRRDKQYQQLPPFPALMAKALDLFSTLGQRMVAKRSDASILTPAKNQSILRFLSRLLLPIWNKSLLNVDQKKVFSPGISTRCAHPIQLQLVRLVQFMNGCKTLLREGVASEPVDAHFSDRQMTAVKKKDFRETASSLMDQKDQLQAMEDLSKRTSQAIDLYLLIFQQGSLPAILRQKKELSDKLQSLTFSQLFLSHKRRPILLELIHSTLQVSTRTEQTHFADKYPYFYNRGEFDIATKMQDFESGKLTLKDLIRCLEAPLPVWALECLLPHAGDCLPFLVQNYFLDPNLMERLHQTFLQHSSLIKEMLGSLQECTQKTALKELVARPHHDLLTGLSAILLQEVEILESVPKHDASESIQARQQVERIIQQLKALGDKPFEVDLFVQNQEYFQLFLINKQLPRRDMSRHHMLIRVVARCHQQSTLGSLSTWPLTAMSAIKRLSSSLTDNQLLTICQEVQRKNTYHPNYYQPVKQIFQNWPETGPLDPDPRRNPFWMARFIADELMKRHDQVLGLLCQGMCESAARPGCDIQEVMFWIIQAFVFLDCLRNQHRTNRKYLHQFLSNSATALKSFFNKAYMLLDMDSPDEELSTEFKRRLQFLQIQLQNLKQQ